MIKSLADLFDAVDETPLARDMHTAPSRLKKLIINPHLFTFDDCYKIADILDVDDDKIIDLIKTASKPKKNRKGQKILNS